MTNSREQMIHQALSTGLNPTILNIINDSMSHAGHAGHIEAGGGPETHFKINIEAECFVGKTLLERQRMVYAMLDPVFADGVHSISLTTNAPGGQGKA